MDLHSLKDSWIHEYASLFMYTYMKRKTKNLGKCNAKSFLNSESMALPKPWFQTYSIYDCEKINFYYFKPFSLWHLGK